MIVNPLPSPQEIHSQIPIEGIDSKDLAAKFPQIDKTNTHLFSEIVRAIGIIETRYMVKPLPELPSNERITAIMKEAKRRPPPRERLEKNQKISSKLLEPVSMYEPFALLLKLN
jgi:hypothetical protein